MGGIMTREFIYSERIDYFHVEISLHQGIPTYSGGLPLTRRDLYI